MNHQRAIVSGAAGGIGAAVCRTLISGGWAVAAADKDAAGARLIAEELGPRCIALEVDVTDRDSVDSAVAEAAAALGGLDTVISCAGIIDPQDSSTVADTSWDRLMSVNLDGTFRLARAAYPYLTSSDHPSVVFISSIAAHIGLARRAAYTASKGAVEALVRCLAVEWAPDRIRVNAVAPGYVRTDLVERAISAGSVDEEVLKAAILMGRLADPAEMASVIAFLAGEAASFVTGQVIVADGGMTVKGHW